VSNDYQTITKITLIGVAMNIFKSMNLKFLISLTLAFFLVGCQTTKTVDTGKENTRTETVTANTGSGSSTSGIDYSEDVNGTQVNASANGIVKDAYGNVIGNMVDGVFVPCTDCPQATAGSTTGPQDPLAITTIYFDYDQTSIKPEFISVLEAHANNVANSGLQLRLEGHADERGSREYNIGLGERRAQSIKRAMMLSGASSSALTTISYGEEQPAVSGASNQSYSQNRRVELVYR